MWESRSRRLPQLASRVPAGHTSSQVQWPYGSLKLFPLAAQSKRQPPAGGPAAPPPGVPPPADGTRFDCAVSKGKSFKLL